MNKKELRKQMLQKRNRLDAEYRKQADEAITAAFLESELYRNSQSLFIYISYSSEVDTQRIISQALQDGKKVLVPRTCGETRQMDAVQITDFKTQLCQTCCGILEPDYDDGQAFPPEQIDLIVVPGVAFDRKGFRIGYGGGYYDKYLCLATNATTIGFAYEQSLLDALTPEIHDRRVNRILTERKEYILQ